MLKVVKYHIETRQNYYKFTNGVPAIRTREKKKLST